MSEIVKVSLIGVFFGTFGTVIGGIIGCFFKKASNKILSFILSFASGLMMSIICFDLIPEALEINTIQNLILGIILGIIVMIFCDIKIGRIFEKKSNMQKSNKLLKTGIIIAIGLAIHNFPEGLAIGSGFGASVKLGLSLAIAICLHDIPEGISMAIPMKNGGMNTYKVLLYVLLSGLTTGLGAFVGIIIGKISEKIIALCLSFAAGAMLYIVSGELIPESNKLYSGRFPVVGNILGFILGIFVVTI